MEGIEVMSDQRLLTDDELSRIREIRYDCDGFTASLVDDLLAHIDALTERLSAAEKDAERYRWLRSEKVALVLVDVLGIKSVGVHDSWEDTLDAAIDAAKG